MKCWYKTAAISTLVPWLSVHSAVLGAQTYCPLTPESSRSSAPLSTSGTNASRTTANAALSENSPIEAEADNVDFDGNVATFSGNVEIVQDNLELRADTARFNNQTQDIDLQGNIHIDNRDAQVKGSSASMNLLDDSSSVENADYVIRSQQTRGSAETIHVDKNNRTSIDNGTYTRCPIDNPVWSVKAKKIVLDPESGQGKAKHAQIRLYDVPVAYLPYAQFPIGEQRQSGLLPPSYSHDDKGHDITLPYYFNIAPNIDATLAPRYKESHGYITEGQVRWLNRFDEWTIDGSYIDNDRAFNNETRWSVNVEEKGTLYDKIHSSVHYTDISDPDYFRDINSASFFINRSSYLTRSAEIYYQTLNWDAGVLLQDFKAIDRNERSTNNFYEQRPQAWLRYQSSPEPFRPELNMELTHTAFSNETESDGGRTIGDISVALPMQWSGLNIEPRVGYQRWHYRFDEPLTNSADNSRQLDIAAQYAELELWSNFSKVIGSKGAGGKSERISTITPRILYQHQSFSEGKTDSTLVPLIDSLETTFNRAQLLSRSRFSGEDIAEELDQLSVLVEQKLYNARTDSELQLALGQKWYVRNDADSSAFNPDQDQTAILGEASYRRGPSRASLQMQWDSEDNHIDQAYTNWSWRSDAEDPKHLVNIGYSYRQSPLVNEPNQTVEQAYLSFTSYIDNRWGLFGQYQYDLNNDLHTESLAGIEYNSCCVKLRAVYRDGLNYDPLNTETGRYDRRLMLQVELKGLINFGQSIDEVLNQAIDGFSDR